MKQMPPKFPVVLISLLSIITLLAILSSPVRAGNDIRQEGYLKDKERNRVFTLSFESTVSEDAIKAHAEALMHSDGRMTAAYYYQAGARIPGNQVTLAGNIFRANALLYDAKGFDKWTYAYMKGINGSVSFVNCTATHRHDLCRQN